MAEAPCVPCDGHGTILVAIPLVECAGSRFTALFEAQEIERLRKEGFSAAAHQLLSSRDPVTVIQRSGWKSGLVSRR